MLVTNPQVMLMDEPLAHLDQPTRRTLRLEIRKILEAEKYPSICVTHIEDDVYTQAESVSLLKDGLTGYTDTINSFL